MQGEIITPRISCHKASLVYFEAPRSRILYPPLFENPPPLEGYFQDMDFVPLSPYRGRMVNLNYLTLSLTEQSSDRLNM